MNEYQQLTLLADQVENMRKVAEAAALKENDPIKRQQLSQDEAGFRHVRDRIINFRDSFFGNQAPRP